LKELRYGKNKESVLHLVVRKWHNVRIDDLINDLIDIIGFQPDITDEQGNTPLHFPPIQFLSFTSHNTFMQLIAKGCSPTIQNKNGDTFLETAILYYPNLVRDMKDRNIVDLDTVRMRKNRNVYHVMFNAMTLHMQTFDHNPMFLEADDDGISPLMLLLENQNTTNRKVFVNSNYEFLKHYTKLSISSSDTVTPLQYLIRKGLYSTPLYALYLEISPEQVLKRDEKSPGNPTTLHQLVTGASSRVLEAFFKVVSSLGKDNLSSMINAKTEDTDATPLVIAAQHGNIEALDTLLKHGASIQQCQVNLAQSAFDNRQYLCALHMLCSEQFKQVKSTVDMMAKSLKMFLIFNEKKQDALIVKGLERVLQDNKQDRNQFFELLCRVTNTEMENHEFVRQCSIFQLLCLHRKKVIIEWILDTFTDLLAIEVSPFDVHPLDIITENEPLFDNNCFHFACNDGEIASLTTEEFIEDAKPNQTATKSLLTKLMAHNRVKQKDLLNQFNKIGDTPTHLSCKANLQSVWADMIANGANMNLPNKKDKLPVELISETSKTAFTKCISGKTKPTKVAAQKKAPVKKAAPKRKRKDEDEFSGEEDASEQVQEPPRIRRKK
jgi:ankyrin repeat protein